MRIVFMGTPDFAVPSLEALIKNHEVLAVVTNEDKPKGRGKKFVPPIVKEVAIKYNIPVFQPKKMKDEEFLTKLHELNPDIIVVAAYGHILPEEILNLPKFACINVHGSLLPKYRGAAPIQWSVINGDKVTGVTIMYMAKGLDCGDMILKAPMEIFDDDTYGTLRDRMSHVGAEALLKAITMFENNTVTREVQNEEEMSLAPKITKEMEHIDFNKTSVEIRNLIRGLSPEPGAYCILGEDVIKIWDVTVSDKKYEGENGEIVEVSKKNFTVKTSDGGIIINELQISGKKRMTTSAFMCGRSIEKHTILK